jgi:DNA-binding transcriptional LysR family regulator
MSDIEVRELRYFIAVAEELNFTRAAERLGIAQPPLSKAVSVLEQKIGAPLLRRTTRLVELTAAGAELLEQGRIAVEAVAAAGLRAARAGKKKVELVVAVKPGGDGGLLRKIVTLYERETQVPRARVVVGGWGEQLEMLRGGRADVALLRAPFDGRGVDFEVLLTEPRRAVLPRFHRLAERARLKRQDLQDDPVPRWPKASRELAAFRAAVDHLGADAKIPDGPAVTNIVQLLETVALGEGVAFLPASAADLYRRRDVVYVPVADITPSQVAVAWPEASRSRATATFVRAAVEAAKNRPTAVVAALA